MSSNHYILATTLLTTLAGLASACVAGTEAVEEESVLEAESELSFPLAPCTESPGWPKTVSCCVDPLHAAHSPFTWVSSPAPCSTGSCISFCNLNAEICNISATVGTDGQGHTSTTASYSLIDTRDNFFVSNDRTVPVGQGTTLVVPAPHSNKHCCQVASLYWEVYNAALNTWYKVPNSDNVINFTVSNPSAGDETYRIRCSHPNAVHYSDPVKVTWVNSAPQCTVSCPLISYPTFGCTVSVSGGVGPFTYFYNSDNGPWYQDSDNYSKWVCKYLISGYSYTAGFKARDSLGNECVPATWQCGLEE